MKKTSGIKNQPMKLPARIQSDMGEKFLFPLLFIMGLFLFGYLIVLCREPFSITDCKDAVAVFLFFALFTLIFLKLNPYLSVTDEGICYKEFFFFPKREVPWPAIREVWTTSDFNRMSHFRGGVLEMDIVHDFPRSRNPIAINVKPFSKQGLMSFVETVALKAPRAKLDGATEAIRKGIMPSLFKRKMSN